jgi:hypothetical protein
VEDSDLAVALGAATLPHRDGRYRADAAQCEG